jgi:hypothetical protein
MSKLCCAPTKSVPLRLYRSPVMSTETEVLDGRLTLTLRTSWLSEFRTPDGELVMFEVSGHLTSFGMLCAALALIPGVEFAELKPPARFVGPARLRFKGVDYEVSFMRSDYRVAVLDPATPAPATEELLAHLRESMARRARHLPRQPPLP